MDYYRISVAVLQLSFRDAQVFDMNDKKVASVLGDDVDADSAEKRVALEIGMKVEVVVFGPGVGRDPVVGLPGKSELRHFQGFLRVRTVFATCTFYWKNKTEKNSIKTDLLFYITLRSIFRSQLLYYTFFTATS